MGSPDRLSQLPFKSCIMFYGRSILPPILLEKDKNEISEIRKKAVAVEKRLAQQKERKCCPPVVQEREHISEVKELDTSLPFSVSINSSSSLEEICEEEDEVIVINSQSNKIENGEENDTDSPMKLVPQNPLLDSVEIFQSQVGQIGICVPSDSNNESVSAAGSYLFPVQLKDGTLSRTTPVGSDISDDQKMSEVDCQSFTTVIANDLEEGNGEINSVAQSTDLEKYLDCSTDESQLSDPSTIVGESVDQCVLSSSVKEAFISDDSSASTPVVPLLLQSPLLDIRYTGFQNPFSTNFGVQSLNSHTSGSTSTGKVSCNIPPSSLSLQCLTSSNTLEKTSPKTRPLTADAYQKHQRTNSGGKKSRTCTRHRRSSSYTIEIPSPVLLKSHAGCQCLISPGNHSVPHCTPIELRDGIEKPDVAKVLIFPNSQETMQDTKSNKSQVAGMQNGIKDYSQDGTKMAFEVTASTPDYSKDNHALLAAFSEAFKKAQDEKIEKLLNDQQEQWARLQAELNEHSQQFQKHIENLRNASDSGVNSLELLASECAKLLEKLASPEQVKEFKKYPEKQDLNQNLSAGEAPLSILSQNRNCCRVVSCLEMPAVAPRKEVPRNHHVLYVLDAVSDPKMQKKFERVSAAVKGYLTRRLFRTVQVQKLRKIIVESALLLSSIYDKSGHRYPRESGDGLLASKLLKEYTSACNELFRIFIESSSKERMEIISQSREYEVNAGRRAAELKIVSKLDSYRYPMLNGNFAGLSSATLKRLQRKQMENKKQESPKLRSCRSADSFSLNDVSCEKSPLKTGLIHLNIRPQTSKT